MEIQAFNLAVLTVSRITQFKVVMWFKECDYILWVDIECKDNNDNNFYEVESFKQCGYICDEYDSCKMINYNTINHKCYTYTSTTCAPKATSESGYQIYIKRCDTLTPTHGMFLNCFKCFTAFRSDYLQVLNKLHLCVFDCMLLEPTDPPTEIPTASPTMYGNV